MYLHRAVIASILFNFALSEIFVKQQTKCQIEDFFEKFLRYNQLKCINIHNHHDNINEISDEISKCLWKHFEENLKIPVYYTHTHGFLKSLCENHIFVDASNRTFAVNDFPPFSKILLINKYFNNSNLHSIFQKSLNVFSIKMDLNENNLIVLPDIISLIDNTTMDWTKSIRNFLNEQQFITVLLRNEYGIKELRASYTYCPPSVITTEAILDGIEIRIVNEIGKNWKVSYLYQKDRGVSKETITNNVSDVSLCTNWITDRNYEHYGLTKYFDLHCATFLVQKPTYLNSASYIFISFDRYVWIAFIAFLIVTAFLLKIITTIGLKINKKFWSSSKFNSVVYSFLEIVNTATSHGVFKFPGIHLPIKIVITSWMLMVLLYGTFYTTGYTSLLARPPTTKPIDTIQDFIDAGYIWGDQSVDQVLWELEYSRYYKALVKSFRNLTVVPDNWLLTLKYGRFVKILSDNNYVTATESLSEMAGSLRLMKECLFQTYAAFIVQKNSGLNIIFDLRITQFLESGIIQHWNRRIDYPKGKQFMLQFFHNSFDRSTEHSAVSLDNVSSGFYVLFIGLVISCVVFLIELLL